MQVLQGTTLIQQLLHEHAVCLSGLIAAELTLVELSTEHAVIPVSLACAFCAVRTIVALAQLSLQLFA